MIHTLITLSIIMVAWFFGYNQEAAGVTVAFYIGREHAQAEQRTIEHNYFDQRDYAPWWCGFEPRAWNSKSLLDWIGPLAVAIISSFI